MENLIEDADFFVRVIPFPAGSGCDAAVTPNPDGTYSVYLDARTTWERRRIACDHEVLHMVNGDFWNDCDIRMVEGL